MTGAEILTVAAALCCAVVAGAFLAFSTFVMHGLGRLPSAEGIAAMQSINVSAVRPAFMITLFGTALVCVAAAVVLWGDDGGGSALAGAALYLLGTIGVTIVGNVPLNNQLATIRPNAGDAAAVWRRYLSLWTNLNHVRTTTSLAAAVLFAVAVW